MGETERAQAKALMGKFDKLPEGQKLFILGYIQGVLQQAGQDQAKREK